MYKVEQCGVKLKPPSLVVTYIDKSTNKRRCRTMPVRNFKESSSVAKFSEELKSNQRHRTLLSGVTQIQIEKLLLIIQGTLKGISLKESISAAEKELTLDPNKDLNKLDEDEIAKAKKIMEASFEKNRVKPDDDGFEYDIEVDFDQIESVQASGWDDSSGSDNDEF